MSKFDPAARFKKDRPNTLHPPREVFRFIVSYKMIHDGNSPSIREIMQACDIPSSSNTILILEKLARQGKIMLEAGLGRSRSIKVVGARWMPPGVR